MWLDGPHDFVVTNSGDTRLGVHLATLQIVCSVWFHLVSFSRG